MKLIFSIALLSISISSCFVYIATKESDSICKLHAVKMRKAIVKVKYGRSCNSGVRTSNLNAKKVVCMGCVIRSPRKRVAIIYRCPVCLELKRADRLYWKERKD